ncbi:MAG: preprotein translocase subunit SecE [Coriobacteriales bacterium]|nr:preprotein translocase subunit SecE [Coriobacteriales bacterium]
MAKATTAPDDSKVKGKGASGKPAKATSKTPAKPQGPSGFFLVRWYRGLVTYIKDVRTEMKRVVWPTRSEVVNSSVVVVVTLIFFIAFTLVADQIVIQVLKLINRIGG